MRELTELENWILALAGRADPIREHGTSLPQALIQRRELRSILESANENWGSKEDHELDRALSFLFEHDLVESLDLRRQTPDGRQQGQIVDLDRRLAALEQRSSTPLRKDYNVHDAFRITSWGQLMLGAIDAKNKEALEDA